MDDVAVAEQTEPSEQPRGSTIWLGAGAATGAAVTLGLVLLGMAFLSSEPAASADPPRFVEEAAAAGIAHAYEGDTTFFVGGGVAVFDCNADGKPDLYFAGGSSPAALYRNESPVGGALRFEAVPGTSTDLAGVTGAYPLDFDSDGIADLAVLRVGANVMLRGIGDCGFEGANEAWNVDGGAEWTAAFSATWEGDAALPTMAFGNYLSIDEGDEWGTRCADHTMFRPDGAANYADPMSLAPGWCTLSILFSDWGRTGTADLRMTNDRHYYRDGEDQLWLITANEDPRPYTRDEGWQQMRIWGMGIASHDLTGDGMPEVFLTSQGDNKLQTLADGASTPTYTDVALQAGATATRPFVGDTQLPSTAWHPEFQDVNNDGYIDLFVTKGNVEAVPEYAADDPNNLLLGTAEGTFIESAGIAGIANLASARGAALADFNLDGMLDLVEVNRRERVKLWRSVGWGDAAAPAPMGSWLAIRLEQPRPNRDGIGSWVEIESDGHRQEREVTIGGGHAGGQLGWIHFGLGAADSARLRIHWPDGETGPWRSVNANRFVIVGRGGEPEPWSPSNG